MPGLDGREPNMAKNTLKIVRNIILGLVGLVVLAVGGLVVFVKIKSDPTFSIPATGISASDDPETIARGEYLFHGPMHCTACHAGGGLDVYLAAKPGEKMVASGGQEWKMGPLGTMRAANLTSDAETGIGAKSDEHLARVIKHGVGEDGKLRPLMALAVAPAADEDVRAIVSYLRTLAPLKNAVPADEYGPVGMALVAFGKFAPRMTPPPEFVREADEPSLERGRYLAHGPARCAVCHSPYNFMDDMKLEGMLFSGCFKPDPARGAPDQEICAPNLTTHPQAGRLAGFNEESFVARMKTGAAPRETIMPWVNYANMTDSDLRSIFMYLQSVPPSDRQTGPSIRKKGWTPEMTAAQ